MSRSLLDSAARAKLNVIGMNVEPKALIDCFAHLYRRKGDAESITCYLDIGCSASRAIIARGSQIFFARAIPVGGDHFNKAVSQALKISLDEAKLLRIKQCAAQPALDEHREKPAVNPSQGGTDNQFAVLDAMFSATEANLPAASPRPSVPLNDQAALIEQACNEPMARLVQELDLCRRYYESTFPSHPVDRLIFVGGEARHRALCQSIAREMGLAAQLGDPLVRMSRVSGVGIESGIDRRQPQPSWAVAIGLSLGPAGGIGAAGIEQREATRGAA